LEKLNLNPIKRYDYLMLPINLFIPNITKIVLDLKISIIAMNPFANFFWIYKKKNYIETKI